IRRGRGGENGRSGKGAAGGATKTRSSRQHDPELHKRQLLAALTAFRNGDFTARLPSDLDGLDGRIADAFNEVIAMNELLTEQTIGVARAVGKEGRISERVAMGHVRGGWSTQVASVNSLIGNLVHPISETARVIGAVAKGDLSQSMSL